MTFSQSSSSMSWSRELDGIGNFISTTPSREEYNNPEVLPSFPPQISPPPSTPNPSPTIAPTPTPAPSPSPSVQNYAYLSLSEVVACPTEGNQEWIEIFNNSQDHLDLKKWIIKDSHSNQRIFDLEIDPWSYGIVTWSGALLNNSGDQVVLVTPNNYELTTLDLPSCTSGTSYARFNDEWEFTDDITPRSANSKSNNLTPSPSPTSSTSAILSNTSPISTASSSQTQDATQQESQLASLPYQGTLPNLKPSAQVLGASIDTNNNSLDSVSAPLRPPSFSALSAIIGGLCITLVGSYSLYETLNQETSSMD